MKKVLISTCQINPVVGAISANCEAILKCMRREVALGAKVIIFPEMAITGYPPEDLLFYERFLLDSHEALKKIAASTQSMDVHVIVGAPHKIGKSLFNGAFWIHQGKIKDVYHKQNLPNYGVFDEKRYFEPGKALKIWRIEGIRCGVSICEDLWVPQSFVYQKKYTSKIDILINISASPFEVDKSSMRHKVAKAFLGKSKKPILYCNLVGGQDELVFDGGSFFMDAGSATTSLGEFEEGVLRIESRKHGQTLHAHSLPSKANKKNSINERERRIYQALVLGLRDYVLKNGFSKVALGLSGGIDSALVCKIAVDALGADNVLAVTMPSKITSSATYKDALRQAKVLGVRLIKIPIHRSFSAISGELRTVFKAAKPDITEENLQARLRGIFLMAISNKMGYLILPTGNKSEFAAGYCTLYGDMCGSYSVLKDVPKTWVYRLCHYLNSPSGSSRAIATKEWILKSIIKRPPTAELRPNQKDQDSLPPYETLDEFICRYVEGSLSPMSWLKANPKGVDKDLLRNLTQLVDRNEYKRRQSAPGPKISSRVFGKDRRMPITNKFRFFA